MVPQLSLRSLERVIAEVPELAPEKPCKGTLSPAEMKVLSALNCRTSSDRLCEQLDFEYTERQVIESIKSLLSKEFVVVVCSAYAWGVEFSYLSKEAALEDLKCKTEIGPES